MIQQNKSANLRKKNVAYQNSCNNSRRTNLDLKCRLKYFQVRLNASIETAKGKSHNTANKLIPTKSFLE